MKPPAVTSRVRSLFIVVLTIGLSALASGADHTGPSISPDAALAKLLAGNARYASGAAAHPRQVKPILPAVEAVKRSGHPTLDAAIDENARRIAAGLTVRSSLLEERVKAGTLKIVAARYDLDSGRVTLVK
jgi:carbonic anhydrase